MSKEPTLTPGVKILKKDYDEIVEIHKMLYKTVAEYYEKNNSSMENMIEGIISTLCIIATYNSNPMVPEEMIHKAVSRVYNFQAAQVRSIGVRE